MGEGGEGGGGRGGGAGEGFAPQNIVTGKYGMEQEQMHTIYRLVRGSVLSAKALLRLRGCAWWPESPITWTVSYFNHANDYLLGALINSE